MIEPLNDWELERLIIYVAERAGVDLEPFYRDIRESRERRDRRRLAAERIQEDIEFNRSRLALVREAAREAALTAARAARKVNAIGGPPTLPPRGVS